MTIDIDKYTAQLTKDTMTSVTGQYFDGVKPFAFPRTGNECKAYLNGRDYLAAVAKAIRGAHSFIFIADWQLDVDVELDSRGVAGHPGRLSELIYEATQRGVHVKVMLYDSIRLAVNTHDDISQTILDSIPKGNGKGSIQVLLTNPNTGRSRIFSKNNNNLFSHHQKFVVVDGQLAFIGGLDLAYGRWDTNAFNVVIDPAVHVINDAYNLQLSPARKMSAAEVALTKESSFPKSAKGSSPFLASQAGDELVFNEKYQPRQPWQDAAMHIKGPAVYDIFVNFVLRWNSFAGTGTNNFDNKMAKGWFEKAKGASYLVDPLTPGAGTQTVQICRSVSSEQLKDELHMWSDGYAYINDDWKKSKPERRKIVQEARKAWVDEHQTSIKDAMVNCIRSAKATIYIENQFFISNCGEDKYGTKTPASNTIISELASAVGRAVHAGRAFHIWVVLPEQPEGPLETGGVASQAWWALQGVKRGSLSLVNRIDRIILEKNLKRCGLSKMPAKSADVHAALAKHGMGEEWRKYLTVLNLRNYGQTSTAVMSELIYVHSKLLIVDDAVAIMGSANINDRSLNGNGDTEIAAVVVDTAGAVMTDMGQGVRIVTRKFARDLRMNMWKKHLGMLVDEKTTGVQKEAAAPNNINIAQPLSKASIEGILALARKNSLTYSKVFPQVPRNSHAKLTTGRAHAFPLVKGEDEDRDFSAQPDLQPGFMNGRKHKIQEAHKELRDNIKGFWIEMQMNWAHDQGETPMPPLGIMEAIANNQIKSQKTSELVEANA